MQAVARDSTPGKPSDINDHVQEFTMYDMYPEWGPTRHRDPATTEAEDAVQLSLDLRDNGGQRPDDN